MDENLLKKIKNEYKKEIKKINSKKTKKTISFKIFKKPIGVFSLNNKEITDQDIILSIYKKYIVQIKENDTNKIYVYMGTYIQDYYDQSECSFDKEVDMNNPNATHRIYRNLEGLLEKCIKIEDCDVFEKNNIVLFVDDFYEIEKEFLSTSVKENQEKAIQKVLKKYK